MNGSSEEEYVKKFASKILMELQLLDLPQRDDGPSSPLYRQRVVERRRALQALIREDAFPRLFYHALRSTDSAIVPSPQETAPLSNLTVDVLQGMAEVYPEHRPPVVYAPRW